MKRIFTNVCLSLFCLFTMAACSKETATVEASRAKDYFNLEKGRYITYDLDSMKFVNFGQDDTVIHYEAKDVVDEQITDNSQRPAWRIIRYLRPAGSTNESQWKPSMTYMIVEAGNNIEVIENNLRFVKMVSPVKENYTWRANTHLPFKPFDAMYSFSMDEDIQYWESVYEGVGESTTINGLNLDNTVMIRQVEDSVNVPIEFVESIGYKVVWNEQYARGIGLISKNVEMWEYQPPTGGQAGFRTGFAVSMKIRDHN